MAFTFSPDFRTATLHAGEPIAFSYQPASRDGVPEDLTGRAFVFVVFDSFTYEEIDYFEGTVNATGEDPSATWSIHGDVSTDLAARAGLAFELSERLDDGREVIATGALMIKRGAPRVSDNPSANFARYIQRITRLNNSADVLAPEWRFETVLYDASGTVIPFNAITLDGTAATALSLDGTIAKILALA